ncbi:MAG: Fe-Mn family superoxide dismutase [Patescibacteria group bacterium]
MHEAKNFDHLLGMQGMSEQMLKNHFTLYQGYVKNTNLLMENLFALVGGDKAAGPEFAEQKRRMGWEFNGMRLHEYYFENLTKEKSEMDRSGVLAGAMEKDFGSVDTWRKDFQATGSMRGIGWAITYFDPQSGRLMNTWVNEHDVGHIAGAAPILVMDVFEHAFMLDYGLNRADYIAAFFNALDWNAAEKRFTPFVK